MKHYTRGDVLELAERHAWPAVHVRIGGRPDIVIAAGRYAWLAIPRYLASENRVIVEALQSTQPAAPGSLERTT